MLETGASTGHRQESFYPLKDQVHARPVLGNRDPEIENREAVVEKLIV